MDKTASQLLPGSRNCTVACESAPGHIPRRVDDHMATYPTVQGRRERGKRERERGRGGEGED